MRVSFVFRYREVKCTSILYVADRGMGRKACIRSAPDK
jgi:hypothetical protein